MEEIVLYTIGCPSCMVLEKKLMNKKINFEMVKELNLKMFIVRGLRKSALTI